MYYREKYYIGLKDDSAMQVKLTGNWETLVGEQDTFVHILEYENYGGFDKTSNLLKSSPEVCICATVMEFDYQGSSQTALSSIPPNSAFPCVSRVSAQPRVCTFPYSTSSREGWNIRTKVIPPSARHPVGVGKYMVRKLTFLKCM